MTEPMIFEVDIGPSTMQLVGRILVEINYIQVPIITLFTLHIISAFVLFKFKNNLITTSVHFLLCCFFISITNVLNDFLTLNWERFLFKQNYFDPNCIFLFTFWTIPFSSQAILIILTLFIDLCKSIAVHRYFDNVMRQVDVNTKSDENVRNEEKVKKE